MLKKLFVFIVVVFIAWMGTYAQDTTELVLENGINDYEGTRDTTIYDENSNSNGAGVYLFAGRTNRGSERRALLAFDLADVPEGATITFVSLNLTVSKTQPENTVISLHRLTADWGEGVADASGQEGAGASTQDNAATWTENFHDESSWENAGGDFVQEASAQGTAGTAGSTLVLESEGLVADLQAWVDGEADNFGWAILGNGTAKRFHSANSDVNEGLKPRLVVRFTQ